MTSKRSILIVEDERIIARDLQQTLQELGYDAWSVAASADEAIAVACKRLPDLVLMDIRIKGQLDGIQTAEMLQQRFSVPVVFVTAHADEATLERAKLTRPYGYLVKPVESEALRSAIEVALYRHQLEQRLREREQWFSTTLHSITDAVIAVDLAGKVSFMNRAAEGLTGTVATAVLGKPIREVLQLLGSDESPLERALRAGQRIELSEAQLVNLSNGAVRVIADSAAPVIDGDQHLGAVMVFRDITEQRRLRQRLELADRLASLGTMAAGIAHEVNNPLTVVAGNVELLALDLAELQAELEGNCSPEAGSRLTSMTGALADVRSATRRISHIVSDLQTFCKQQPGPVNHADVARCLEWALRASAQELKHRARVVTDLGPLPPVALEETRLGQVLINLLVNAAQALPPGDVQDNVVSVMARATPEGSVVIDVHDTGPGIPQEALPHIFEPFFTTKSRSIGTGLGLSICHGIVSAAGGTIEASSELGRGTNMRVTLPVARPAPPEAPAPSDPAAPFVRGKILIIDDEPIVLKVLARSLQDHDVVCMTSARAALERLALGEQFDLIFTDLLMPTMTGMALYDRLLAEHPELCRRVVFLTGGPVGGQLEDFLRTVPNPVLSKPFDLRALQRTVQRLLRSQLPAPK